METRGTRRSDSNHSSGRRLRTGLAGIIAVVGAIFMGGATGVITASAHSGSVTASETCTTWTAEVKLANNVTIDRIVDVVVTPSTLATGITGLNINTKGNPGDVTIWGPKTGPAPATGTFTLNIYQSVGKLGKVRILPAEFTASASIKPPTNCASTPAIATTPAGKTVPVGAAIHDVATVTGSGVSPAGTVVFSLFPPSNATCAATGTPPVFISSPITLVAGASGVSTATGPDFTTAATGTYHWVAAYTPAAGAPYTAVSSLCADEAVVVNKASPSIATLQSAGGNIGVVISDTATVSGGVNPTGTVTFDLFPPSNPTCSATGTAPVSHSVATLSGGKADSAPYTTTSVGGQGTYQWVATYSGDANNRSIASGCTTEAVVIQGGGGVLGCTTGSTSPTCTPGGVGGITTPSTGDKSGLTGLTIGGFLLLGGLGIALMGALVPRRRRI